MLKKITLIIIVFLSLFGCMQTNKKNATDYIPENASVVKELGNGWVEFELEGNRFLFHRVNNVYRGWESITQIK